MAAALPSHKLAYSTNKALHFYQHVSLGLCTGIVILKARHQLGKQHWNIRSIANFSIYIILYQNIDICYLVDREL